MRTFIASLAGLALVGTTAVADTGEALFEAGVHCVAYRTTKDVLFRFDAEVVGRSCEVAAALVLPEAGGGPRVVVTVPVRSLKSGNVMRNKTVSDLLGAETQPDLRFTSNPLDVATLRSDLADGRFVLPGTLSMGGREFPVEFPLELAASDGQRAVLGRLATTFEAFEVEVPTVAGGLIARPHEDLELVVRLDVARGDGLEEWARAELSGLSPD